ncbi:MAG TPA: hypothetical protein VFN10_14570 [Thermoanaerobaculia bacterium]|nr:hypothetical protein [Thermoanaerobaculia bacterium]
MRVLLVEASNEVRQLAERVLSRVGAAVDAASSVAEAMTHLGNNDHVVVVTSRPLPPEAFLREPRPVVIAIAREGAVLHNTDFDPVTTSMVVPEDYDASALVGVVLACVTELSQSMVPVVPPIERMAC